MPLGHFQGQANLYTGNVIGCYYNTQPQESSHDLQDTQIPYSEGNPLIQRISTNIQRTFQNEPHFGVESHYYPVLWV